MKMIDNNAFDSVDNNNVDDDDSFLNDLDFIKFDLFTYIFKNVLHKSENCM